MSKQIKMELIVKQPESLEVAKGHFMSWASTHPSYNVLEIEAFWQPNLFNNVPDAIVYATVVRSKHGKTIQAA